MGCSILQQCSLKLLLGLFQITDAKEAGDYGRHNPSMLHWVFLEKSATQSSILAPRSAPIRCARLCECSDSQNNCSCSMHQHGTKTEAGAQPGLETVVSEFCGLDELAGVWGKEDLGCTTVNLDILTMAPQTQNPTQVGPRFFVLSRYMGPCTTAGELGNTAQTRNHQHTDYHPEVIFLCSSLLMLFSTSTFAWMLLCHWTGLAQPQSLSCPSLVLGCRSQRLPSLICCPLQGPWTSRWVPGAAFQCLELPGDFGSLC